MTKITKKYLMERALNQYNEEKIEKATEWQYKAIFRNWKAITWEFGSLNMKRKISKSEYILKQVRSWLLNRKPTESNKRLDWDTSSNNIVDIGIILK